MRNLHNKPVNILQKGCIMEKIKEVGHFIKNGFSVLRDSSYNSYSRKSDIIKEIKEEFMDMPIKTISDDKKNLIEDRKAISRDVRSAYNKIALKNG